ncbi:hypothetical protein GCM10010423_64980 [Streptomyces levis]|uniref:Uncharacterized protein n=1 Tax=Streptomyces levis TaxID=285566 RepID=A0ABP6BBN3_9ACTN
MLSDDEFYDAIKPHLRAKSAGQKQKITPKDASATWSNGEKDPDGVTESVGPNGPKLSITATRVHRDVPVGNPDRYGPRQYYSGNRYSGWAWPVVDADDPRSPVDGIVNLVNGKSYKVRINHVSTMENPVTLTHTVKFILTSLYPSTKVDFVIKFEGSVKPHGEFEALDPGLNDIANDWMVRYMMRQINGK